MIWLAGYTPVDPDSGAYLARDAPELAARGLRVAGVAGAARHHAEALATDAAAPGPAARAAPRRGQRARPQRDRGRHSGRRAARLGPARAGRRARAAARRGQAVVGRRAARAARVAARPAHRRARCCSPPRPAVELAARWSACQLTRRETGATSASSSSATRRRSGSRCPHSTSRRIARRQAPSEATSASTGGSGRTMPGDHRALHRDRAAQAGDELVALVRRRADRGHAARTSARSRSRRARRAARGRTAASRSAPRAACRARSRARSAAAPRRARPSAACGARRASRTRAAGPPRRARAGSRRSCGAGRWRAGSRATGRRRCAPRRSGPSAGSASSHSRSAVCRRRSRRPACSRLGPSPASCSSAITATVAYSSPRSSGGASRSATPRTSVMPSPSATSVGLDHEPVDRRDDDRQRAAGVGGILQLGERGGEALRRRTRSRSRRPTSRARNACSAASACERASEPGGRRPRVCR